MKRILLVLAAVLCVSTAVPAVERPIVNIPPSWRQSNWPGREGMGSCVHATMISLMRWQGRDKLAIFWKSKYDSGEYADRLAERLNREGVRYAYVTDGDVKFLEWAVKTRRGCGITVMGGAHMVALVHLDSEWAAILDNNSVSQFIWIPRNELIAEWKFSMGWAVAPVYSPIAPAPAYRRYK